MEARHPPTAQNKVKYTNEKEEEEKTEAKLHAQDMGWEGLLVSDER